LTFGIATGLQKANDLTGNRIMNDFVFVSHRKNYTGKSGYAISAVKG
jgi:hypothetical protein